MLLRLISMYLGHERTLQSMLQSVPRACSASLLNLELFKVIKIILIARVIRCAVYSRDKNGVHEVCAVPEAGKLGLCK
jgi:hypothetical protein